ncbi:hypothetical protein HDU97_009039 [Phlyctochytrium planicorne]|nr:hypothetical protein HDU97_009039 [Phlyctochytrium planicorne]
MPVTTRQGIKRRRLELQEREVNARSKIFGSSDSELLLAIGEFLDRQSLCNLVLAAKLFLPLQRLLLAHISIPLNNDASCMLRQKGHYVWRLRIDCDKSDTRALRLVLDFASLTNLRHILFEGLLQRKIVESIAVPLYRTALHRTSNSIRRTRSLLHILPNPIPENVRIDPVAIPRRSDILLQGMDESQSTGSIPSEWVTYSPKPQKSAKSPPPPAYDESEEEKVILFLHGGAFIMGSPTSHRFLTSQFSQHSNAQVLAIDYRLAPEHPFPLGLHDAISAYLHLVDPVPVLGKPLKRYRPDQIVLVGDSAGGGLCFAVSAWLHENGYAAPGGNTLWRQPAAIVAMAPWVDLTHSMPSFHLNTVYDYLPPTLTDPLHTVPGVRSHPYTRSDAENANPLVSPLFSHAAFPKCLVQVGERERLRDEGMMMGLKGDKGRVEVYEDMVHCFQVFGDKVGDLALKRAGEFIRNVLGSTGPKDEQGTDPALHASSPGVLRVSIEGNVTNMGRAGAMRMVEDGKKELERIERRRKLEIVASREGGWWSLGGRQSVASPTGLGSAAWMPSSGFGGVDMVGRLERRMELPLYRVL